MRVLSKVGKGGDQLNILLVSFHDILVIEGADVLLWGRMKRTQDEEDNNRVQCDPSRQKARLRRVSNAMNANGQSAGHPSRHNWC